MDFRQLSMYELKQRQIRLNHIYSLRAGFNENSFLKWIFSRGQKVNQVD